MTTNELIARAVRTRAMAKVTIDNITFGGHAIAFVDADCREPIDHMGDPIDRTHVLFRFHPFRMAITIEDVIAMTNAGLIVFTIDGQKVEV